MGCSGASQGLVILGFADHLVHEVRGTYLGPKKPFEPSSA